MTRRIPTLLLIAAALTTLSACETPSVGPQRGMSVSDLEAPSQQQQADDGPLFMKWLTRPPSGVNGMLGV